MITGFRNADRRWVRTAGPCVDEIPPLEGVLHLDPATLQDHAQDAGRLATLAPAAVLRPGSAGDVAAMMRFCRRHGIPVAARGLGNTTGGQALVGDGLVVDARSLAGIAIGPGSATAGAGATWLELARAAHPHGLAIPAATGYLHLTLGGTLSVGGVPPAFAAGAMVDHVRELEVVTGDGEIRRCSSTHDPELFEAVLAGLGQFGVITSATVALLPAPATVRGWSLAYTDRAALFRDLRTLAERGEVTEIYADWWRPGEAGEVHHLTAFRYVDGPEGGADDAHRETAHLLRGLSVAPAAAVVRDSGYLEHITRIDDAVEDLRATLDWDGLVKPWFTVWLPESTVESYVGGVLAGLTPRDVGEGGFVLMYVQRRSALTRPSLRLPAPDGSDRVYLFTLMTAGGPPGAEPGFGAELLARNRGLFERARAAGGVRYPIESVDFTPDDWRAHYGERWAHLAELRRRHDPDGLLTPGPGAVFG